jgi:membrane protein
MAKPAFLSHVNSFLHEDLWRMRLRQMPRPKSLLLRMLRIFVLASRGFDEKQCRWRASALTFYSLLSIVPVLAMAFGVAQGFGLEQHLEALIRERVRGQQEVVDWILQFSRAFLQNTQGGLIAGVGIVLLFWSVIKLLEQIESSFNDIWGVQQGRSFVRKLSDYLSMMLVCPVLFIVSSSLTVLATTQLTAWLERAAWLHGVAPLVVFGVSLLPMAVVWLLFSFLYLFIPNTRVSVKAGVLAGIIAGVMYQAAQWAYLTFQIGVARHNAIYGSFAALPLFLIWLQTSWMIVLFGAEISFAVDNEETYEFERDCRDASLRMRRLVALRIVALCAQRFSNGEPAPTAVQIAHELDAPIRLVRGIVYELTQVRVLSPVPPEGEPCYQPAQDVNRLTVSTVLQALRMRGSDQIPMKRDAAFERLAKTLDRFDQLIAKAPENKPLKDV